MVDKATVEQVQTSFGRALHAGPLMQNFYRAFLASHPEIPGIFARTDMAKQKELLRQGVGFAIMFAAQTPIGMSAVSRLANSHSRDEMDIDPRWYPLWKSSLISSVASLDPDFSPSIRSAWETVLQECIDFMSAAHATAVAG